MPHERRCASSEGIGRDEIESFLVGEWCIVLNRSSDGSVENSVLKCIQSFHGTYINIMF